MSTGSTKKKPMTKKEREEKRRKHKKAQGETLEEVVSIVAHYSFSARMPVPKFVF